MEVKKVHFEESFNAAQFEDADESPDKVDVVQKEIEIVEKIEGEEIVSQNFISSSLTC